MALRNFNRLHVALVSSAVALGMLTSAVANAQTITFGEASPGKLPPEFEVGLTGGGPPPRWEVVSDSTAVDGKALAQLSTDRTDLRFPLAIHRSTALADVEASTRFKAVSGKVDQAGGLAVRLQDQNNYYVTRANALEDNVRFYRVVNGRRQQLASANVKVTAGEWHTLTLRARAIALRFRSTASSCSTIGTPRSPRPARLLYGRRPTA
jgi:hypothetical protein